MGVYSNLDRRDIEQIVGQYDRGKLSHWSAITSGIENSNFLVELTELDDQTRYVLTLIEVADFRRSQEVVDLMTHLTFYECPLPDIVTSHSNQRLVTFRDNPVTLCTWLPGHHVTNPTLAHCNQLGQTLAQFHQVASAFRPPTHQPYDTGWLAAAIDKYAAERSTDERQALHHALSLYEDLLGANLPSGWTHGDVFRDNVLFLEDGTLNGLLDYFHAGSDPFVMDLAIAINDWCGSMAGGKGEQQSEDSLLQGYQDIRALEAEELRALPVARIIAAARLLCSRLSTKDDQGGFRKDPEEYAALLNRLMN